MPKKYPSKILRLFVILFAPEILFGKDCLCSIVLVRGSFQDNVAVLFISLDYHEGPQGRELFVLPRLINADIVFAIRDTITSKSQNK